MVNESDNRGSETTGQVFKRAVIRHLIGSVVASIVTAGGVLLTDLGGIRSMALSTGDGPLFVVLLFLGLLSTFGVLALAAAVMTLPKAD